MLAVGAFVCLSLYNTLLYRTSDNSMLLCVEIYYNRPMTRLHILIKAQVHVGQIDL